MIKPSKFAVFAGVAVLIAGTVAVSAAQIALRGDLPSGVGANPAFNQQTVNRSAKSDRLSPARGMLPSSTMSFQVPALENTVIVARIPAVAARRAGTSNALSSAWHSPVACEPPVSVLTNVAKFLGPSHCVT